MQRPCLSCAPRGDPEEDTRKHLLKRRVSAQGLPPSLAVLIQPGLHLSRGGWKLQGPAELRHAWLAGRLNTDEQGVRSMPEGHSGCEANLGYSRPPPPSQQREGREDRTEKEEKREKGYQGQWQPSVINPDVPVPAKGDCAGNDAKQRKKPCT